MAAPKGNKHHKPHPLNEALIKELAQEQATLEEIAARLETSTDTLRRRYATRIDNWRKGNLTSLRHAQWKKAMAGDSTMLKHLGRVLLGQHYQFQVTTQEPEVRKLIGMWEGSDEN